MQSIAWITKEKKATQEGQALWRWCSWQLCVELHKDTDGRAKHCCTVEGGEDREKSCIVIWSKHNSLSSSLDQTCPFSCRRMPALNTLLHSFNVLVTDNFWQT